MYQALKYNPFFFFFTEGDGGEEIIFVLFFVPGTKKKTPEVKPISTFRIKKVTLHSSNVHFCA